MKPSKPECGFSRMKALQALVLKMVAGFDLKGVKKIKTEEAEDILLLLDDKGYLDVKPDVDENLARKEDYDGVEKVKDDLDNVKFSEIKENDENCDKLKETEEVILIKYEDKLYETLVDEDEDEETLGIPQESSHKDSASSGIFFPEGCGSEAEDDNISSRMDESNDAPLNKKVNNDHKLSEEQVDENTKVEESYDSGYDDGNAQEVLDNNESVSTTGESFPNDTPESRLANEIKVQHEFDEIFEVLAHEPNKNEDKVKPVKENNENKEDLPPDSNTKEPIIKVTVTMDWREVEKAAKKKCRRLQTELNLYTPDDIDGHYNEAEFHKKLGAMQDLYCEVDESINELLDDYDDVMPTKNKEHWKRQAAEILEHLKSHQRQIRSAVTRVKGNVTAPASISSVSAESNTSKVARAKRKKALSKMKTLEQGIENDAKELQEKIDEVSDWKLENDVSVGRGMKKIEKWDEELGKIVQMMRDLQTLQREFDVDEGEIKCDEMDEVVNCLREDVKEVKRKIVNEDNERQLYSLDTTKVSKVNLPTFEGKDCEDFSKFKENIEKGFVTNRISRDEQIIKLRECLKGYARKLVPDSNVTEIKEAWRILKQAFGNPIKIINQRKEALMKLGVKPKAKANLNTEIAWYIDLTTFLREIIDLGVKNPDYSELIFSNQFAMEIRQLFPHGRLKDKLRKCSGGGRSHLENMLELMNDWLENAQINQQENDIISRSAFAICRYSSGSSSTVSSGGSRISLKVPGNVDDSDDEEEEDFVDDRNTHESFGNISQQVRGANLVFMHVMPSFEFSEDYGNPSQTKSVTSLYKEKLVNAHNEWEMNESVEELLDEEQEDLFEYQEVSFEESDDDQDFVEMNDDNHSAAFKEAVSKNTNVAEEELHNDETSGKESDDEFNLAVKEDKMLVSQETSDEEIVKDNEAVLEDFKETTNKENDDQRSLLENDDQRILIEDDDQKGSIDEADDQSNTEDEEVLDKDEEHVGVHYDFTGWDVVELHDEILEVLYEDLNDAHEVSVDDEDECDDAQTGKLSTCAEESFHNVATQTSEEMPDNYEESTAKETDDKFSTEVDKEILNYVNETFEVMNEDLNDGLEVFEDDAAREHLNPDENADAALEDDEDQYEKPDVIKMLFKGTFSENAMEILENLNKFKKINFGNRDANGLDAHFSSPENPSYTLVEELDDKDSETESFQVSEAIKNQSELRDNDLNVKAKEVESDEDVIENVVDNDQKVDAENTVLKTKTVNQMVFPMLADWFVTSLIAKVAVNILMCMRQFVVLSHLLALSNMLMEINTDFMEKVAQMMKMNGCCCASLSLLTGGERKDGGPYHAEETVTVYMSPTTMDSLNNLLAVNTDYTEMEEEPDYLASVDTPTQSNKTLYGKGHSF